MTSAIYSTWYNRFKALFIRIGQKSEQKSILMLPPAIAPNTAAPDVNPISKEFWSIDNSAVMKLPQGLYYCIGVEIFFIARHYVVIDGHTGIEHTHSYRLRVKCASSSLISEDQVVIGYHHLRDRMKFVVSAYNNKLLNSLPPFQSLQPTTENLTGVLFQQLERSFSGLRVQLLEVTIWESPTEEITVSRTVNYDA
jgi:6-pyruvoyltetrahydropterin/6-carboxytetrahydropterin synthase